MYIFGKNILMQRAKFGFFPDQIFEKGISFLRTQSKKGDKRKVFEKFKVCSNFDSNES